VWIRLANLKCSEEMARPMPVQQNSRLELLTTAQAAEVLNVHPNTVRNWADSALLPSYRIGPRRDRRFRRQDVESLLSESGNGHDHS
jgi:excisionase family DNA binding protein